MSAGPLRLTACRQVREVVNNFYGSKYATCLNHLQRLEPLLSLDLFLSPHAKDLCAAVCTCVRSTALLFPKKNLAVSSLSDRGKRLLRFGKKVPPLSEVEVAGELRTVLCRRCDASGRLAEPWH